MKRIYVAGPMTGLPDLNFPAFNAEAARLRAAGWEVLNPAEINPDHTMAWAECMRRDIAVLVTCDAVQLLPNWRASRGATLEHHVARELGLEILQASVDPDPAACSAHSEHLLRAHRAATLAEFQQETQG